MPASFQAPMRRDKEKKKTVSQSVTSNLADDNATVGRLLGKKGKNVFSIRPQETIETAVGMLKEMGIGALLVTEQTGKLVGILSERDIVRKLADTPGQTLPQTVAENMTENVITCSPNDSMVSVLRKMTEQKFRHMPVVENDELCGMVTIGDVVTYRINELEHEALQLKQMIVG